MTAILVGLGCLAWVVLNVMRGGKVPRTREVAAGRHARGEVVNRSVGDLSGRQSEGEQ